MWIIGAILFFGTVVPAALIGLRLFIKFFFGK